MSGGRDRCHAGDLTSRPEADQASRVGALVLVVLASLTALAPLATDMYVSGLPELTRSLGTSISAAQLSLTTFLVGVLAGQLVLGPISDGAGRRPVLLAGSASFAGFSLVCALAPTIEVLNLARLCQGVAGAAGIVVARAVITDTVRGAAAARGFSTLAAISSAAPIAAPVLGGAILTIAPWRAVFAALAVIGLLLTACVFAWVPESHPAARRHPGGLGATFRVMAGLARRRALLGHVLALAAGGAAVFTYISGSAFIFQDLYGASPTQSSLIFGVNALGNLAGSISFGWLATRIRIRTLLLAGLGTGFAAAAVLTVVLAATGGGFIVTWACLFAVVTSFGIFFPAVTTAGQELGRDAPGSASALLGGGQFLLGAAASPIVGLFGTASAMPIATIIAGSLGAGILSVLFLARASRSR
ncbi:multidrug effflux MFS transporter [Amycolatopsis lurida]